MHLPSISDKRQLWLNGVNNEPFILVLGRRVQSILIHRLGRNSIEVVIPPGFFPDIYYVVKSWIYIDSVFA